MMLFLGHIPFRGNRTFNNIPTKWLQKLAISMYFVHGMKQKHSFAQLSCSYSL